jgi:hypothetical protein
MEEGREMKGAKGGRRKGMRNQGVLTFRLSLVGLLVW